MKAMPRMLLLTLACLIGCGDNGSSPADSSTPAPALPSCGDGIRNGDETSTDCGGSCDPCLSGEACAVAQDCRSTFCLAGTCTEPTCRDEIRNADESDVDCGGACGASCDDGRTCRAPMDCQSGVCVDSVCRASTCDDQVRNGDESSRDCGGRCPACEDGRGCATASDCQSGVCSNGACAAARCEDLVRNGDETDVDCGGSCLACAAGLACSEAQDCQSGVCTEGACAEGDCQDMVRNADETDVDCGGSCGPCADGLVCGEAADCQSGVCADGLCRPANCADMVLNGDETAVDCGGSCGPCADGLACMDEDDCRSGVCTGEICAAPTCTDMVRNGDESDIDCGGICDGCPRGSACRALADCDDEADGCVNSTCVAGPIARFTVNPTTGQVPLLLTAQSQSTPGDAPIVATEYDFGAGAQASNTYTYTSSGTYSVRQRVTDANGLSDQATVSVRADPAFFCFFSSTDIGPAADVVLTPDGLGADWLSLGTSGVRSECSVGPRSGVYYVEISRAPTACDPSEAPASCIPSFPGLSSVGIGTRALGFFDGVGDTNQGFGVNTGGSYFNGGYLGNFDVTSEHYGFVVDYRGAFPIVHFIADHFGAPELVDTRAMTAVSVPVHVMVTSAARLLTAEFKANFGNDLTNAPFHFDPAAILRGAGLASTADVLVFGFGGSTRRPVNNRPGLTVSADRTVAAGTTITLTATATDAEDGSLTSAIVWEDMATLISSRVTGTGGQFTFTSTTIGVHPIRVTVVDSGAARRQATINVTVTGALPRRSAVVLDTSLPGTGAGIVLDSTGRRARWVVADKMGVRANQGMIGSFQYFEVQRLGAPINQGAGVVIGAGSLNPYRNIAVPPSLSINTSGGIWQNIMYLTFYDVSETTYGFAVDYRGLNPRVYVIMDNFVVYDYVMYDAFVPVYPMVYGNFSGTAPGVFDIEIKFAAPFSLNPASALTNHGVPAMDVAALQVGWSG